MKKLLFLVIALFLINCNFLFSEESKKEIKQTLSEEMKDFKKKQSEENTEFKKGLKGKSETEKNEAIKLHKDQQFNEKEDFLKNRHEKIMNFMNEKLCADSKVTEEQRTEILDLIEKLYLEKVKFKNQQFEDNADFIEKIANDTNMSIDNKKKAIKEQYKITKVSLKEHKEKKQEEVKAIKQEMKQ